MIPLFRGKANSIRKGGDATLAIILIRTLIIFTALVLAMRLLGKRQLGEMELSELVVAVLVADIAVNPLQDTDMPLKIGRAHV